MCIVELVPIIILMIMYDYVIALLKTLYLVTTNDWKTLYLVTTNDWVGHAPDPPF